ncbi:MAG: DUF6933 domain-containing protein [Deltaproteobacteria bacterium]
MVVLRCTQRLLRRLNQKPAEQAPASSTVLGDWYANIIWMHRRPLVLAVSARSLLPVLFPARDPASLGARFSASLGAVLAALGIPADQIDGEQRHMAKVALARTISRQILGTMNDFGRMLDVAPGQSLLNAALDLAKAPCGPIGMESPDRVTVDLFGRGPTRSGSSPRFGSTG